MLTASRVRSGLSVKSVKSGPMRPAAVVLHNTYATIVTQMTTMSSHKFCSLSSL